MTEGVIQKAGTITDSVISLLGQVQPVERFTSQRDGPSGGFLYKCNAFLYFLVYPVNKSCQQQLITPCHDGGGKNRPQGLRSHASTSVLWYTGLDGIYLEAVLAIPQRIIPCGTSLGLCWPQIPWTYTVAGYFSTFELRSSRNLSSVRELKTDPKVPMLMYLWYTSGTFLRCPLLGGHSNSSWARSIMEPQQGLVAFSKWKPVLLVF